MRGIEEDDYELCIFKDLNLIKKLLVAYRRYISLYEAFLKFFPALFFMLQGIHSNYAQIIHSSSLNVNQGLSQSNVTCFIKDQRGFLWIGTQDGLNRYDGYEFKTFKHEPSDTNSLSNNFINDLVETRKGNIWVATNYGLNRYDPSKDEFEIFLADSAHGSLPENQVFNLYQDDEGFLWIKTLHYLTRFNPGNNQFVSYKHFNDYFNFYEGENNFDLMEDHEGNLWIGTKDGLNYFNQELEIFKRYYHQKDNAHSLSNNNIHDIYEDDHGNLWIATDKGLNKFNRGTDNFEQYYVDEQNKTKDANSINDIWIDNDGLFWVGTDAGLYLFDQDNKSFRSPENLMHHPSRLINAHVNEIKNFRSKLIWVGTLQGMLKLQKNLKDFNLYKKNDKNQPLFGDNMIASVYKQNENLIWVGTWDEGLFWYNRKTGKIRSFTKKDAFLPSNDIHSLFRDSRNRLWIGTNQGILFYDLWSKSFHKPETKKSQQIFNNNRVYSIAEDHSGRIWFATRNGLHVYDRGSLHSYYENSYDTTSLTSSLVYDVMVDHNGTIWAGTNKGLNQFLGPDKGFRQIKREDLTCSNCLVSNEIICLQEDSRDNLWIGTVGGLNKFDPETGNFKTYTEKDGLPNNLIYAILEDDSSNLWLSSNMGLTKFDPDSETFLNFDIYDGLQDYEFNHLAACKASNGELFFGGISGLNSFYPDSIMKSPYIPNIEITSVEIVSNKKNNVFDLVGTDSINIPYRHNFVSIEFSALDLIQPSKNNYAYKLEGLENDWVEIGQRRYATFSNLSPGKYVFRVKGTNNDNVWSEKGTALHITVETPFWREDLAYVIYTVLFVSFVLLIIWRRNKRLRKAKQQLKYREEIAEKLAQQKEELTLKNKNITDSLVYAKRIQEALLPSDSTLNSLLRDSFLLYKPKDIVSGDFYWINEKDDKLFLAVVDCTGHGVPGAFMSIIGVELLDNVVNDQGVTEPDQILYHMNKGISLALSKENNGGRTIRDGMDIALCVIDRKEEKIEFSGAFRPLYLLSDNKIKEVKGDRFSLGLAEESFNPKDITRNTFSLNDHDMIYLFTDGYADQFGGPEGKKYKYRRFRHLLLNIHKLPMSQQKAYLNQSIEDWRGNREQIDDILILGFNPKTIGKK